MTQTKQQIIIVDDDASICSLLRLYLESYGYDVTEFNSGEAAVLHFEQHQLRHGIHLAIVDQMMPGMDGITTFQKIHAIDASLPVIMLTAFPTINLAIRFIQLGGINFITKPLIPESGALALTIKEALHYKHVMEAHETQYIINKKALAGKTTVATESLAPTAQTAETPWKILIVDDDKDVHTATGCILQDFMFNGRPVELHSATSVNEAKAWIDKHIDVALILLDIVMETEYAGFDIVEYIRDEMKNKIVRILLRTESAGEFPEQKVVFDHQIDGYLTKDTTSPHSLSVAVTTALRAYRDLTLIEQQRQEITKQKDRAKQSEQAILDFLSSLQHETGTKTHHVLSYIEMALSSTKAGDTAKAINRLEKAYKAGDYLKLYHQELSLVAHLIAGRVPFRFTEYDTRLVIDAAWKSVASLADDKNITLKIDGEPQPLACIDHLHLEKALSSLLHNAVKFSPKNSTINVYLAHTSKNITIAIQDHGAGIEKNILAHITDPFTKDSSEKKISGDRGFGLMIVRYITDAHNGSLNIKNSAEGGAIFTLTLPIHHDTSLDSPTSPETIKNLNQPAK